MDLTTQFKNGAAAIALATTMVAPALAQNVSTDAPQDPPRRAARAYDRAPSQAAQPNEYQPQPQPVMTAGDACRKIAETNFTPLPFVNKGFASAGNLGCEFSYRNGSASWTKAYDLGTNAGQRQYTQAVDSAGRQNDALQQRQERQDAQRSQNEVRRTINDTNQAIGTVGRVINIFKH